MRTRPTSRELRSPLFHAGTLLVLMAMAGMAWGQPKEGSTELASRIDQLIAQLDDEAEDVRNAATKSLMKIGTPALAQVTAAARDKSPERSQRALAILRDITRAELGLRFISQLTHEGLMGAVTVVLSPDGKFVYVPAHIAGTINVFHRDEKTGELTVQQTLTDQDEMDGVVTLYLSEDGKYAVASAVRSKTIALYTRDQETGKLELKSKRRVEPNGELASLQWPSGAIFSTDSKFVYVIDDRRGMVLVFKRGDKDQLDFVEIFHGQEGCFMGARGISAHRDGKTLYVTSHRAGTLVVLDRDPTTGKLGVRQILRDEENGVHGLAGVIHNKVSRDGKYVYTTSGRWEGDNAVGVFQVGADGKLTVLQEFINGTKDLKNFEGGATGLAITPDGMGLYASGTRSASLACFHRDPSTGKLTYLNTLQSLGTGKDSDLGANGMEVSADGKFLYLAIENASAITVFERSGTKLPLP